MEKTRKEEIEITSAKLQRERRKAFLDKIKNVGITVNDNIRGIYYCLLIERR